MRDVRSMSNADLVTLAGVASRSAMTTDAAVILECADRLTELAAEVETLRGKLPKTADGVTVVPGMIVWDFNRYAVFERHVELEAWEYDEDGGKSALGGIEDCYSTPAAAEAARNADNKPATEA